MQDKKVKIIYFSLRDSGARELEFSWRKFYSFLTTFLVVMLIVVSGALAIFTDFYQNLENSSLSKLNRHLKQQVAGMGEKIAHFESRMKKLEVNDDDLRLIAGLSKLDADIRNVGIGGGLDNSAFQMTMISNEIVDLVYNYKNELDAMERRIELTLNSQAEIKNKLEENKRIIKHTPSIRPVIGGALRDKFGMRLHPIINTLKRHPGVDYAAERGTEVYATAAGVVEKAVTNNTNGYGKYIIIDHGFGLKTLYGHLSKVFVKHGQRIDRWKPIGLVGSTGLSTGPHLHYEVHKDGKQTDPLSYVLN